MAVNRPQGENVSDYQFNDADAVAWRKSTFAEGIEVVGREIS
jgi:hypothetical protein